MRSDELLHRRVVSDERVVLRDAREEKLAFRLPHKSRGAKNLPLKSRREAFCFAAAFACHNNVKLFSLYDKRTAIILTMRELRC